MSKNPQKFLGALKARDTQRKAQQKGASVTLTESHSLKIQSGPIPAASELAEYEKIEKGLASRIVAMAEHQAKHRQRVELIRAKSLSRDSLLGLICGFGFGLSAVALIAYCASQGYTLGALLGGGVLLGIISSFVSGTRWNKQEAAERSEKIQRSREALPPPAAPMVLDAETGKEPEKESDV